MHTHREQNTRYNNMQHIQDNTEQNKDTENNTENTQHNAQPQRTEHSAHNFSTYSLDYYQEFAYIKNSDTIELYTILQENI